MGHDLSKLKRNSGRLMVRSRSLLQLPSSSRATATAAGAAAATTTADSTPILQNISKLFTSGTKKSKSKKILLLSLDAAGKTTLLNYLKTGRVVNTIPTIGYNHEEIEYKKSTYSFWDVGGQEGLRQFWCHYFFKVNGIIFMVDSNDRERLDEARQIFREIINNLRCDEYNVQHVSCPVLILANKQDLADAMSKEEIYDGLGLNRITDIQTVIITSSVVNGIGIDEIFEWLHESTK